VLILTDTEDEGQNKENVPDRKGKGKGKAVDRVPPPRWGLNVPEDPFAKASLVNLPAPLGAGSGPATRSRSQAPRGLPTRRATGSIQNIQVHFNIPSSYYLGIALMPFLCRKTRERALLSHDWTRARARRTPPAFHSSCLPLPICHLAQARPTSTMFLAQTLHLQHWRPPFQSTGPSLLSPSHLRPARLRVDAAI
jgi:hypothetical protein